MPRDLQTAQAADLAAPFEVQRSAPNIWLGLRRGIGRKCPACGKGALFCGYLAVTPTCTVCGNDNEQYPSDDFAPYVTIFLVLHLMVPILFAVDRTWDMAIGWEMALAVPIFAIATLALLPFTKGGVIGFAWARGVVRSPAG
jgi:uncharacterized protein (DUF983 family)